MGYELMVTLVPLADVERVRGSGDEILVHDACTARGQKCAPELAYAIGRIVDGTATDRARASQYGYAMQRICQALGEDLDNGPFYPSSLDALEAFDAVLKERGVRFATSWLALDGSLFGLPEPDDFPMCGKIGPEALARVEIDPEAAPPGPHEAAWRAVAGWVARARERAAEDPEGRWALVGFWY